MIARLAAAVAIAEYVQPDCAPEGTFHAHDLDADYPAVCEVCGRLARVGLYCSEAHRIIVEGKQKA